jgi:hypothetical protein
MLLLRDATYTPFALLRIGVFRVLSLLGKDTYALVKAHTYPFLISFCSFLLRMFRDELDYECFCVFDLD